ncbi:DHS-like NAD/FAD-binding domain-containing protein [Piedraia hortae CBS 480.64]|uniref:DHS-like NAD/FAD-binding domain-containing protein n=1 Tax=Piedraia hortae CBS 480.64 TaxID=1314780 RepID=A0A6A7BQC5_9PEZI|nr:DHS-like NAD/FAD-binding domain-containing protein [Piedraia hortae CBS 480.64]
MRIPYTSPLPAALSTHTTLSSGLSALSDFLTSSQSLTVLTGAGISVPSGLSDYRGAQGTYSLNPTYVPIFHSQFLRSHLSRQRYWARSFFGFPLTAQRVPNAAHEAVGQLRDVAGIVTQNVDSLHVKAHPWLETVELHGYLRETVCGTCGEEFSRLRFQKMLSELNPAWGDLLERVVREGGLETEDYALREKKGLRMNPDGDLDVPGLEYERFRYPPCPHCVQAGRTVTGSDGEYDPVVSKGKGVLKPAVVMFGENIPEKRRRKAQELAQRCDRLLVLGTSLATYSAWRLVKEVRDRNAPIAIVNLGGVRNEEMLLTDKSVRLDMRVEDVLPKLVGSGREFMPAPWR